MQDSRVIEPRNRVVQLRRFGGPEELEVVDAPMPTAVPARSAGPRTRLGP